jgi:hypothetical protein
MDSRALMLIVPALAATLLLQPSPRAAQAAQGETPMEGQPLVFNQDCNDVDSVAANAPAGERSKFIRDWYRRAFAAGARVFVADVTTGPIVETKDTPGGEVIGARFSEEVRKTLPNQQTLQELFAEGTDVLHLACGDARKAGVVILGGARMSDAHHGSQAKRGYADYLAPMEFFLHDVAVRPDDSMRVLGGTGCLVYPGFGQPRYSDAAKYPLYMRSLDEFRALARNIYAWGGAGASVFNMYLWTDHDQEFSTDAIAILSGPAKALAGPRHYVYLPHAAGAGATGKVNEQSITFGAEGVGKRQVFTFRMADRRGGAKLQGVLRFRVYDATPLDEFAVDINAQPVAPGKVRITDQPQGETVDALAGPLFRPAAPFNWPAGLRFEVSLGDCPAFQGDNELGVTLTERGTAPDKSLVMEALEVCVTVTGGDRG